MSNINFSYSDLSQQTTSIISSNILRESWNITITFSKVIHEEIDKDEEDRIYLQTLVSISNVVNKWIENEDIEGVIIQRGSLAHPKTTEVDA